MFIGRRLGLVYAERKNCGSDQKYDGCGGWVRNAWAGNCWDEPAYLSRVNGLNTRRVGGPRVAVRLVNVDRAGVQPGGEGNIDATGVHEDCDGCGFNADAGDAVTAMGTALVVLRLDGNVSVGGQTEHGLDWGDGDQGVGNHADADNHFLGFNGHFNSDYKVLDRAGPYPPLRYHIHCRRSRGSCQALSAQYLGGVLFFWQAGHIAFMAIGVHLRFICRWFEVDHTGSPPQAKHV